MGLLDEVLKKEKPREKIFTRKEPTGPCAVCGSKRFWAGAYEPTWYCEICSPPKFEAFVKFRHTIPDEDGFEFIEELNTWFGPAECYSGYRRRWRAFYRMTDGVSGMVQEGNECEGMRTIDAFSNVQGEVRKESLSHGRHGEATEYET